MISSVLVVDDVWSMCGLSSLEMNILVRKGIRSLKLLPTLFSLTSASIMLYVRIGIYCFIIHLCCGFPSCKNLNLQH